MKLFGRPLSPRLRVWLWPLGVGLLALAATAGLWHHERQTQERHLRDNFDFALRQTATRIEQRMASYEQMLRGVRGLFEASDEVTVKDFGDYVDALLAGADFAGLRNIAYVRLMAPGGPATVSFVAPAADSALDPLGRDLWADPDCRAAMAYARNSGGVAITRRLRPEGEADGGFLMFMPLYARHRDTGTQAGRQAHIEGWVLTAFRMNDLMASLYGENTPGLAVRIHDGIDIDDSTRIYPGGPPDAPGAPAPRFEAQEYLGFAGHTWTVVARSSGGFEARFANDAARIIAVAGVAFSGVLALLAWLLATARERAYEAGRRMTQELRDSTERYRRIVETANEGIWTVDAAGRTSFVNPKLQQLLGYDEPEMLGRRWAEFVVGGEGGGLPASGGGAATELRLRRKDGSELPATLATSAIVDAQGRHAGVLAMVTDISERQQAEARRSALEAQLRQSQKMEAIGTLAGGVAHDFNNVLAAILGNTALLQQDHADAGQDSRTRLAQIGQAAARARSLVQQIVAFSRQQPQQLSVQALQPLLQETLALLRSTVPAGVEIETRLEPRPLPVNGDATQLQQVLMNLCTNAWHALPPHGGRIEVGADAVTLDAEAAARLGPGLQPGPHAHLWVADNGRGMDEATRQRVFEPFFTTKPVGQGTGLGLSVAHGIVASHHGAIGVVSAPGQGSCFEIWLPLADAAPAAPAGPAAAAAVGQGEHVLYVDDDAVMGLMVEALLQRQGWQVRCVGDAREALALLGRPDEPCDLVVTDFNMPEISGVELARALALLRPGLPVLLSSGFVSESLRAEALAVGVRHVMQKEYTLEQLGGLVQRALAESRGAGGAARGAATVA